MHKTKQEAIAAAWGKWWEEVKDHADENGWVVSSLIPREVLGFELKRKTVGNDSIYRPHILEGIEDNRGWNKIQTEADLPKDSGMYEILSMSHQIVDFEFVIDSDVLKKQMLKYATHWRPKPEIKLPHY